ncbi:uncharacterized protein KY384_008512 [Bacidia gigantensis]|uniref:uncharacterized protein n=1 Tax=Bacidia gigantensis TaxID=2732470 RepID=UPI001D04004A|nr:uncharacterized protein KY384_008512 [Bacidia gigantensis]KAG8527083.1 hypothetical protein KY384_008512 [Bacidia gigantensis]
MARNAFATFIPLSIESDARSKIIFDFFDLMAAVAAHGKTNGMGGRKLSRFAGWWAFEHTDEKNGFDGGYKSWSNAADATGHLFFAYLRSLSPDSVRGISGVSTLPLSLQTLLQETKYPPEHLAHHSSSKVVMVVDSISPTPFALLRRAKNFEYRDDDRVLQAFSNYDDPVQALSDECRRVLKSISSVNESNATTTKASTSLGDTSWSRFEDMGFGAIAEDDDEPETTLGHSRKTTQTLRSAPQTKGNDMGRPITPSWADFLNSGFTDEPASPAPRPLILPPDKILPPIDLDSKRGKSSQSHVRKRDGVDLEPGELASINALQLDSAFWWVWISSLAGEETLERKAVFGRCALVETVIGNAWLVIEEMVKGAAPEPEIGAYIAEKKSRFTFGKKRNPARSRSLTRKTQAPKFDSTLRNGQASPASKTSIGRDQHAKIQAAAAALQEKQRQQENGGVNDTQLSPRRARGGDAMSTKTNSVFTLQPVIMSEAAPAMKWATSYDKKEVRARYLGSELAGKGSTVDLGALGATMATANGSTSPKPPAPVPKDTLPNDYGFSKEAPKAASVPLPPETPGERLQAPKSAPPPIPSAPLPAVPATQVANQVAADAAEVPLPPAEHEGLERIDTVTDQNQETLSPESSPESKRTGKLRKKEGRNFKGFFGKKKAPQSTPPPPKPSDPLAAAAARAALSPKPTTYQGSNSITRRLSRMGRKDQSAAAPPVPAAQADEPLQPPQAPFKDEYDSQVSLSRVDSNEQRKADREFPKFDQGPLADQPAFVPNDSPVHHAASPPAESPSVSRPSTAEPVGAHYEPPITKGGEYEPSLSSAGDTLEATTSNDAEDRWAQIRRNAAERAGKANADDQATAGRKSAESNGDGDGDESAEETIESRVARIKARVAELTGNMQGPDGSQSMKPGTTTTYTASS